jgi:hypothetical protein
MSLSRLPREPRYVVMSLLFLIALSSCQSARETHYFRSEGNYYRLQLKEKSFASKARYLSGYFDEDAVSKYFSEMSQPDSSKVVEWLSHPDKNTTLVMILSTNSNAISEQIGALASNEELLQTVARLSNKDKINESNNLQTDITALKANASSIRTTATSYFTGTTIDNINQRIQDFLTVLQARTRATLPVGNLETARTTYKP